MQSVPVPFSANPLTLPNLLTLLRLVILVPVIILFRLGHPAAALLFAVAMLTDCIDGWIAEKWNQRTLLGMYLDPVVDKIVILALLYELARAGVIASALPHLFLARELLHSAVRSTAARHGTVVGANWMGKTKALLQTILVTAGLLAPAFVDGSAGARLLSGAIRSGAWVILVLSLSFFVIFAFRNRRFLVSPARPHTDAR